VNLLQSSECNLSGRHELQVRHAVLAAESLRRAGNLHLLSVAVEVLGSGYLDLGAFVEADAAFEEADALAARLGRPHSPAAVGNRSLLCFMRDNLEEAERLARTSIEVFEASGSEAMAAIVRGYVLVRVLLACGQHEQAAAQGRAALAKIAVISPYRASAIAALAEALMTTGRTPEALAEAAAAVTALDSIGTLLEASFVRRVYAEALSANGRHEEARAVVRSARDQLHSRAADIDDPALREGFLQRVPDNARILELAREWGC
jgi:tetratricopeptide (TPR) repeat protein